MHFYTSSISSPFVTTSTTLVTIVATAMRPPPSTIALPPLTQAMIYQMSSLSWSTNVQVAQGEVPLQDVLVSDPEGVVHDDTSERADEELTKKTDDEELRGEEHGIVETLSEL
uniref:Uncharacterized protein n=1 Tax=Solanum tuberosum TaxID=4113 RepID=M1D9E7_SOLTU